MADAAPSLLSVGAAPAPSRAAGNLVSRCCDAMYAPGHQSPSTDAGLPDFSSPFELAFRQGSAIQLQPNGKAPAAELPATPTFSFAPSGRSAATAPAYDFPPARSLGSSPFGDTLRGGRPPQAPPPASPFDLALGTSGAGPVPGPHRARLVGAEPLIGRHRSSTTRYFRHSQTIIGILTIQISYTLANMHLANCWTPLFASPGPC